MQTPEQLPIWGETIPYNTPRSKLEVLKCNRKPMPLLFLGMYRDTFGTQIARSTSNMDTYTYRMGISKGTERENFLDIPTLTPFPVQDSQAAVILSPGGGFFYKERQSEGLDKAKALNRRGISAFVLDYRINPYRAPVPWLDLQRAVRYVRANAAALGVAGNVLGTVGFSAGGYVTGAEALLLDDVPPSVEGYTPDVVDQVSGRPDFVGLIYPVTAFYRNPSMLSMLVGDAFFQPDKRPALQVQYALQEHLDGPVPPLFLAYGDKDPLKDMQDFQRAVQARGLALQTLVVHGASHGFAMVKDGHERALRAFVPWLDRVCQSKSRIIYTRT